jgi:hypothetical protein
LRSQDSARVEAQPLRDPWAVTLDKDVSRVYQPEYCLDAGRVLKVNRDVVDTPIGQIMFLAQPVGLA